jgi:beta-carotene isomerase
VVEKIASDGSTVTNDVEVSERCDPLSPYDSLLLWVFRKSVASETSLPPMWDTGGIEGLVAQGRAYMSVASEVDQRNMVKNVLRGLMGPIVPVYRLFMGGFVPRKVARWAGKEEWGDKQVFAGGLFYAPYLTSVVTPLFFQFLVGPAKTSRRSDGRRGGVLVEKCRFLEKSNCKGLCLNQCKVPMEEFFKDELGVDLYVQPNFRTQECQWSWGEETKEVKDDGDWPKGCLEGCVDRKRMGE